MDKSIKYNYFDKQDQSKQLQQDLQPYSTTNSTESLIVTDSEPDMAESPEQSFSLNIEPEKNNPNDQTSSSIKNDAPTIETEEEYNARKERENAERNELSLIRILVKHNQNIRVTGNMNVFKEEFKNKQISEATSPCGSAKDFYSISDKCNKDEEYFANRIQDLRRTVSLVSSGLDSKHTQIMSKHYKLVTSGTLWFCYYSLALNDYIFGPTFNDLSMILNVDFDKIAYFAVYRQLAYTFGSLGGLAFDYINRQLLLVILLLLSAASLILTPYVPNIFCLFLIAIINGFSAGACDVGFHVWILEMFQNGGGPLIQALHFSFGLGIATAPLISANFLSGSESEGCGTGVAETNETLFINATEVNKLRANLLIPYSITSVIVAAGGIILLIMFFYKRYIPPKERQLPVSFEEQMPKQLTRMEKLELWKRSVPSFYIISIILLGSLLICFYYGLEVTYFQFLAQFSNAVPLPIHGSMSANLESATGAAYAFGGLLATWASFRFHPESLIYLNFIFVNIGNFILLFSANTSLIPFWIGNIIVGFGFSSCYATVYTFLEHHINVTNVIGSIFLFTGGAGTAILPLLLTNICSNPLYLVYLSFFCINFSTLLFIVMHILTNIRQRQVKLIQNRLLANPAILTKIKQRTMSQLSYEPE